jgi:hypothetical protein
MNWHFAVCDLMVEWGPPYPLPEWDFRQALGGADRENIAFLDMESMLNNQQLFSEDLLKIGRILDRYENLLIKHGRDY